jgi:putative DNA methylase
MTYRKKLIEVALPLEDINREAAREKSIRHGHPSTLHLWWARRPLATCRAVLFSSLVDDPEAADAPAGFVTACQRLGYTSHGTSPRERLFSFIAELVKWENSNDERILNTARELIRLSTDGNPPPIYDPFCGGGSIPLEAQRLGLEAHASDLNPVPVLINKALIEIPPKFAGKPPVNPDARTKFGITGSWKGTAGLAEDIRYYGQWMRNEAEQRIGHLYPKVRLSVDRDKSDAPVVAWLWARTVASPNPAARGMHVPLLRSFWLSTKSGKKTWLEPIIDVGQMSYRFRVRTDGGEPRAGTVSRNGGVCLLTGSPMPLDYIREEGRAGRLGVRLLAIVADTNEGRIYLPSDEEHERIAQSASPQNVPDTDLPEQALGFRVQNYGMFKHRDLFTKRQLVALTTFCDLIADVRTQIMRDSESHTEYADAVVTYLGLGVSKLADYNCSNVTWSQSRDQAAHAFTKQTVSVVWDFCEVHPFAGAAGDLNITLRGISKALQELGPSHTPGHVSQINAEAVSTVADIVFSTDPPYYDNVPYADLSDFFYVWIRRCLQSVYPTLLNTVLVPKAEELVADPFRHGGKEEARTFFEQGMGRVFAGMREASDARFPTTIYYAFKQTEEDEGSQGEEAAEDLTDGDRDRPSRASTGWETFLQGLVDAGWQIDGTWPMRTERGVRTRSIGSNALASSIVLVCRPRPEDASTVSRRDFLTALKRDLPVALRDLQKGNIAPVDLAQAAIGPGMAVFSRYARVLETDGSTMGVRTALALINQALDEVLAEQEGEFDADTRWALAWFDQFGFSEGPYGIAETLSTAKNTSVKGLEEASVLTAKGGKVRLLSAKELPAEWNPAEDERLTIWEIVHQLIRALDAGEQSAAALLRSVQAVSRENTEAARDLAYRLFNLSERRKRATDALSYNALVISWPEIARLAQEQQKPAGPVQGELI